MTARLAGLITISMFTMGAVTVPAPEDAPVLEFRAASRLACDGDMQANWNRLLGARARLERLLHRRDLAAHVPYQIAQRENEPTEDPLAPEWGLAEAWGWLGGFEPGAGRTSLARMHERMSTVVGEWVAMVLSTVATIVRSYWQLVRAN